MIIPSVTQALGPWADFSGVSPAVLANAAERGTRVHAACAARALGLFSAPLPQEEQGYLESFTAWFGATVAEVVLCEAELVEPRLGFKGHPDLIVRIHGDEHFTVVDLKTPRAKNKLWGPQIAAYKYLACHNGHRVDRCMSLRLKPDGGQALADEYSPNQGDWNKFLAALNAWRCFNS